MGRRDDLAEFLRARRAALSPTDVGLAPGHRRRAPGLRREEVALLAGVSVSWYTWLEQGRPINASRAVLDSLARALRLDPTQHAHLLALATDESPWPHPVVEVEPPDSLTRLVTALEPSPAYVLGPRWELLAWNRAQARLYPMIERLPVEDRNLLWVVFAEPSARDLIVDWPAEAARMVSQFRSDTAALRDDPAWRVLVARLREASNDFEELWSHHDVSGLHGRVRRYRHPLVGELVFEYQVLTPAEWPYLRVVAQLPLPDDDSTERLRARTSLV
jgi:transcriptional regulator with XRE-family HTH domain